MKNALAYDSFTRSFNGKNLFASWESLNEVALSMTEAECAALEAEWNATDARNREIAAQNRALKAEAMTELEAMFSTLGLPTYKRSTYGKILGTYAEFKMMVKAVDATYKTSAPDKPRFSYVIVGTDKYDAFNSRTLWETVKRVNEIRAFTAKRDAEARVEFATAASLAAHYGIALDDPDMVNKVKEADKAAWVAANHPNGSAMTVDCCDECDSWTVGEHRCDCGNRRIYMEVEGSFGKWYAYTAAH